jgi:RimJ/RimL family protein N-acetyltransferase
MLNPNFHIKTPRLYLSYLDPSNDAHMSFFVRLVNSPEVAAVDAQTGVKMPAQPQTISEARAGLTSATERLEKTGTGRYIISLRDPHVAFTDEKEGREYLGTVSMQLKRFPDTECPTIPDIGFKIMAEYYGKGYASEACDALMQHFQEARGHEEFAGFTHPENVNSQKLFKRLGFENRGTMDVAGVVGSDGSRARVAVWVKGVSPGTELNSLGIGLGLGEGS